MDRIDKLLAGTGYWSRKDAKKLIKEGRVTSGGSPVKSPEEKVDGSDIRVDGQPVVCGKFTYIMMNKPAGLLSATEDRRQSTVLDLLPGHLQKKGLFPVGRLDKDTEGLLLLTDDGGLAHRLLSPSRHVDKVYFAKTQGQVDEADAKAFEDGMVLEDGTRCMPAGLEPLDGPMGVAAGPGRSESDIDGTFSGGQTCFSDDRHEGADEFADPDPGLQDADKEVSGYCLVTLREGKFHQVKKMLAARGKPVLYLKRLSMGPLKLDPALNPGSFRPLTPEEEEALLAAGKTGKQDQPDGR